MVMEVSIQVADSVHTTNLSLYQNGSVRFSGRKGDRKLFSLEPTPIKGLLSAKSRTITFDCDPKDFNEITTLVVELIDGKRSCRQKHVVSKPRPMPNRCYLSVVFDVVAKEKSLLKSTAIGIGRSCLTAIKDPVDDSA